MGKGLAWGKIIGAACVLPFWAVSAAHAFDADGLKKAVQAEEKTLRARIGVAALDGGGGEAWSYRGDERFPINSTFKAFACAALLAKVDRKEAALEQTASIDQSMLAGWSPITEKRLAPQRMTLDEVCQAAVSYSDNTAANVVLEAIGSPAGFTAFMRRIGDEQTRLDRTEPDLNEGTPGDPRDTTTPNAVVASLRKVMLGDALSAASREKLGRWMREDRVADELLRSSLPAGWEIADKTGAGGYGSRNIIAVIWPPGRAPWLLGVYVTQTEASMPMRNQAIARIGAALTQAIGR
ncbi:MULTISPECIES: class A beta-lactamase [Chromobacteriaceae]|uniref:class A beta-lactamase n=1 Tax=Chromobacteriaceae TaxID=1499392 RepID=UPI00040E9499|nr:MULTISPECIES: class A beta-lactamase [Chromobacteriaceae]